MAENWFASAFSNPNFKRFASESLQDLGYGLSTGTNFGNALGNATQRMQQMEPIRQQQYMLEEQQAEEQQAQNATLEWLRAQGYNDLVAGVEGGGLDVSTAWGEALRRGQPVAPDYTAEQRNFMFAQDNPEFAEFIGGGSDPTTAMQEYEFARQQGYQGDFTTWKTDVARAGASNIDMNSTQALAGGYADRMANANSILDDPKITQAQVDPVQAGAGAIPGVGNFLTSNERKMAEQAQRDFINAILRRESGAAIAESEFQNAARQYFPQPGDTPEVIEQKRRNREIAIQGVARAAGPGYQPPALAGGNGWQVIGVE